MARVVPFEDVARMSRVQRRTFRATMARQNARVLAGGSGFGGKSFGARAIAVGWCVHMASQGVRQPRVLLGRWDYGDLRDNHVGSLEAEWGHCGEFVARHKDFGMSFVFRGEYAPLGAIVLRNFKEMETRRGMEFNGAIADELTQMPKTVFDNLLYIVRAPGPFQPVLALTNPDGPHAEWVEKLWRPTASPEERLQPWGRADWDDLLKPEDFTYVPYLPSDNPLWEQPGVQEAFLASIAFLPPEVREGRLYGRWGRPAGARWPMVSDALHRFDPDLEWPHGVPVRWRKFAGMDYGLANPWVALWGAIDEEGTAWIYRERYKAGLTAPEQARTFLEALQPGEVLDWVRGDPRSYWQKFPAHEYRVERVPADIYHEVWEGHPAVKCGLTKGAMLNRSTMMGVIDRLVDVDAKPIRLRVSTRCPELWSELTRAIYPRKGERDPGDIDEDSADHALTALVYGAYGYAPHARPADGSAKAAKERLDQLQRQHMANERRRLLKAIGNQR